jgi:branched-chain amino acid transport system substrate-binding protein
MQRRTFLGSAASISLAPGIVRAQPAGLKVAFIATLSGPGAAIGMQMRDGWLAGVKN